MHKFPHMMMRNLHTIFRHPSGALMVLGTLFGCCLLVATATAEDVVQPYPLTTCIVSGSLLDTPDEIVTVELGLREIRFCGADCASSFEADVEGYLSQIDMAIIEAQLSGYPLDTCLKTGQPLGGMGAPYDHVYGNRLVRLCCAGCVKGFEKDAVQLIAVLDEAVAAQRAVQTVEE